MLKNKNACTYHYVGSRILRNVSNSSDHITEKAMKDLSNSPKVVGSKILIFRSFPYKCLEKYYGHGCIKCVTTANQTTPVSLRPQFYRHAFISFSAPYSAATSLTQVSRRVVWTLGRTLVLERSNCHLRRWDCVLDVSSAFGQWTICLACFCPRRAGVRKTHGQKHHGRGISGSKTGEESEFLRLLGYYAG